MVASLAVKKIYNNVDQAVTIIPITSKIGPEYEDTFNDTFWNGIDVILSAVVRIYIIALMALKIPGVVNFLLLTIYAAQDNVETRLYLDSVCVKHSICMIDAGTMGSMGSVQVMQTNNLNKYKANNPCLFIYLSPPPSTPLGYCSGIY